MLGVADSLSALPILLSLAGVSSLKLCKRPEMHDVTLERII